MKPKSLVLCWLVIIFAVRAVAAPEQERGRDPADALFDPSRVIQIEIRLDPKDWHALRISHLELRTNEYGGLVPIAMNYEYYRGDVVIDGQVLKSVGVRKKSTWGSTARPSLKINLDKHVKGQKFSGLEMLTLNSLVYASPDKAHQSLVYSFMNKAGAIAPRSNLARVVVNGEDLGVYGHVESIDKQFIKRHFGNAKGDLYEGMYAADFTTNGIKKVEHKWGPDADLAHVQKLMEVLESPGPVSVKRIEEHVDLDAFITFWATRVLIAQADGYPNNLNNYYFYHDAESGKFFFIPWGADIAFDYDLGDKFFPVMATRSLLGRRLWESPEIRERYRKEMRRLLAEVWDEKAMLAELKLIRRLCQVDRPEQVIRGDKSAGRLALRIESRRKDVQAALDGPAPDLPAFPSRPPPVAINQPPMQVEGSFTAVIGEAFPTNVAGYFGQGATTLQFTIAGETQKPFTQSGAVAVMKREPGDDNQIHILAANSTGDLSWHLWLRMDPYRVPLVPGTLVFGLWSVGARLFQGDPESPKSQARPVTGTLELTHVSTNLGGTILGKFKVNTTAFEEEKKP